MFIYLEPNIFSCSWTLESCEHRFAYLAQPSTLWNNHVDP